jgi:mono/diheme cytochrome c family protein
VDLSKPFMKKFIKVLAIIVVVILGLVALFGAYLKLALPNVGDPEELTIDPTPARIERGAYLANHVTVCMDCHSQRDWTQFSGPIGGNLGGGGEHFGPEMGFPGDFYSKNITPYNLGDWSDGEIFRLITSGVNKDGNPIFPVMPYHAYGRMDREDIFSIIAYIRTLEPISKDISDSKAIFPVNFLLHTMPQKAAFTTLPDTNDQVAYGQYLVNAAGCIDCHTPVKQGKIIPELAFSGGREFAMPGGLIVSSNITSHTENGIGGWTDDVFVRRFKAYVDSAANLQVEPGQLNTIMPWVMYAGMKERDLRAIYAYLQTLEPIDHRVVAFQSQAKN